MKYISHSPQETKRIAAKILEQAQKKERHGVPQQARDKALVLALKGDLGAGKTNFVQGVGEYLGMNRNITSPTFVLMKRYRLVGSDPTSLYHFDCYRIHASEEILDLGWHDIISKKENLILIEWAENIKDILPKDAVWITIKDRGEDGREITML